MMIPFVRRTLAIAALGLAAVAAAPARAQVPTFWFRPTSTPLRIVDPVVCRSIEGYRDFVPSPEAEQTSDEKLLIYYTPANYRIVPKGDGFSARFIQDGQVRRAGGNEVLRRKENLLDYEAVSDVPPVDVYLRNAVSPKGLPPGDYEFDIILRDANSFERTATSTVKFRIVEAKPPRPAASTAGHLRDEPEGSRRRSSS